MYIDERLSMLSKLLHKQIKGSITVDGEEDIVVIIHGRHDFHFFYLVQWNKFFEMSLEIIVEEIVHNYKR